MADRSPAPLAPILALPGAVLAISTSAILIRFTTAPPLMTATSRMLLAAAVLLVVAALIDRGGLRRLGRRDVALMFASGAVLGLHFALWTECLFLTSVASAVLLVDTHPVFVALLAWLVMKEATPLRVWAGIGLTLLGGTVIASGDFQIGGQALVGDLMALGAAATFAVYLVIGRRVRQRLGVWSYAGFVYGVAGLCLLVATLVTGSMSAEVASRDVWVWIGLVIFPTLGGHTVFNWALGHLRASVVSVAILAEPVLSTLLAWLVLAEAPPLVVYPGGALILVGLFIALRAGSRE